MLCSGRLTLPTPRTLKNVLARTSFTRRTCFSKRACEALASHGSFLGPHIFLSFDTTAPDLTSGVWFPITATNISKSQSPGCASHEFSIKIPTHCCRFAILQFTAEEMEVTVEGNQSSCTHMHLHALVPQNIKSPTFTWSMPLPNASIRQVRNSNCASCGCLSCIKSD